MAIKFNNALLLVKLFFIGTLIGNKFSPGGIAKGVIDFVGDPQPSQLAPSDIINEQYKQNLQKSADDAIAIQNRIEYLSQASYLKIQSEVNNMIIKGIENGSTQPQYIEKIILAEVINK